MHAEYPFFVYESFGKVMISFMALCTAVDFGTIFKYDSEEKEGM